MPQIDIVTYIGQVTSIIIGFGRFYLIIRNLFEMGIWSIKLRNRKRGALKENVSIEEGKVKTLVKKEGEFFNKGIIFFQAFRSDTNMKEGKYLEDLNKEVLGKFKKDIFDQYLKFSLPGVVKFTKEDEMNLGNPKDILSGLGDRPSKKIIGNQGKTLKLKVDGKILDDKKILGSLKKGKKGKLKN